MTCWRKFANYGFNKSHAAAYAVVSYQTAYLKANYPAEFMAAVMNCDLHLTDKLAVYKREVDKLGLKTIAPCVNASLATFTVRDNALVYGLGALKNVGVDAMQLIVQARMVPAQSPSDEPVNPRAPSPPWGGDGGGGHPASQGRPAASAQDRPFATLFDFARRVDLKRIGKRPLEMLARAGCFDQLDPNRARVFEALDPLTAYSAAIHEAAASSQNSLFGQSGADIPEPRLPFRDDWLPVERLAQEHQAVGFYLSGHPLDDYMSALRRQDVKTLAQVTAAAERGPLIAKLAGSVSSRQERKSARGNRFAFVQLSDPTGLYEVTCFSEVLEASRDHLDPGQNVVLTVKAELEGETLKLLAQSITPIDAAVARTGATAIRIHLARPEAVASLASLLAKLARPDNTRTRAQVTLCVTDPEGSEIDITLPDPYPVTPQIKGAIKSVHGVLAVEDL